MYPVAIIAAMPQELIMLQKVLKNASEEHIFGQTCYRGYIDEVEVVLTLSGIGKVNAAFISAIIINRFSPRALINTGSAGGLGSGIAVGDVVIGSSVAHHDVDVRAFNYVIGQVPQLPAVYLANHILVKQAIQAAQAFTDATVHEGLIVSGDQFINSALLVQRIRTDFPMVLACEMEAAAIAQTSYICGVPFVTIRAISDHADDQAEISFDTFIEYAGQQSAKMVCNLLSTIRHLDIGE